MFQPWRAATFAAFRHRNFQHYTWGQIISLAGSRMHDVAAGWLMWQLTGSAAWVGALAVSEMIPRLLLWPLAGALADRVDRRRLAMTTQSLAAVVACTLTATSAAGLLTVNGLLAFTFCFGVLTSFWQPLRLALIPGLVSRDAMASAVGLSSVVANIARISGPIVAGPVLIWGSVTIAFGINAISFIGVVVALWLIRLPPDYGSDRRRRLSRSDLSFGLASILRDNGIAMLLGFIAVYATCVRAVFELLPVFAEAVLSSGPAGLGALTAALGFGSLFSGIVASSVQQHGALVRLLLAAGTFGSILIAVFALATDIRIAVVCIAFAGFGVTLTNIVSQILLQLSLTDEIRGRVLSVYGMLFGCAPSIGALAIGWVADRIGISTPVIFCAGIGLAASVGLFVKRKTLAGALDPQTRAIR